MARKARIEDLGKPVEPAVNGGRAAPAEAAAPSMGHIASAFPPIAEYAFLSDCEVNALIAPSGRVEWMCLPRPDSPSVFAAILDRAAGAFRFAPSGVMVPAGRRYLPGTLVLETTWRTRTGWLIVRDALCIGPWYHSQRRSGTHRRPPTDYEAEHILLRTAKCVVGSVELSLDCHPTFNYGQTAAQWEYSGPGYGEAVARGGEGDVPLRLVTDLRVGFEGPGAHATQTLRQGEKAYVALAWPRSQYSTTDEFWAEHPAAERADPQGSDVQPHRRAASGAHDCAAGVDRRRAQLGLPLHMDPRRHFHALGPVHARFRTRGQRLLLLHRRRRRRPAGPADHVRDRGRARAARAHARSPERL